MKINYLAASASIALLMAACSPKTTVNQSPMANAPMKTMLPKDSSVIMGTLPNGLTYYIRKNAEPKNRAELYLVNKVGSIVETDAQQGLAHFTEHMAFNGTRDFPKNELVSYLQKAGVRFGADLNAYTGFNQTVYQLPLPTDSTAVFEKGFDILSNWAGYVTFDNNEIDQERGVIIEEDRQRGKNAQERMSKQLLPVLLANSKYAKRLPIGIIDTLKSFKYETLKQYYKDWYRPDLQAVIAVGDFDVAKVEQLIKDNFSELKNPANEKPRELFSIPANEQPLVKIVTDPEFPYNIASLTYKHAEEAQQTESSLKTKMMTSLINSMLGARLTEIVQKGNAPFIFAQSTYGPFQGGLVDLDAFSSIAVSKDAAGLEAAVKAVVAEDVRMKKFGFTQSELERAKTNLQTGIDKQYKEKDKTKSAVFVQKYVANFLKGDAIPSIDFVHDFYTQNLNSLSLDDINKLASSFVTDNNLIATVQAPEKEKANLPSEETYLSWIKSAGADVTPYVDNAVTEPLMATKPKAGNITSEKKMEAIGVTELTLSNGVKVILKPTDFKNDQILFSATSKGGTSLASDADFRSADMADQLVGSSGIAKFDETQLGKLLTGKAVSVNPYISTYREGMGGSSSPKDLETALQLVNLYFTAPRKDEKVLKTSLEEMTTILKNRSDQPTAVYQDTASAVLNSYKARAQSIKLEDLGQINLDKAINFYKQRFANAADFTFTFVGNFKVDEIKPLLATYLGSLPSTGATENFKDLGLEPVSGNITKKVYKGLEDKVTVSLLYHGNYNYSPATNLQLDALKAILDIKITERLREKESGVYSPGVNVSYNDEPKPHYQMGIYFSCATANLDKLIAAAEDEVSKLKINGATAEDIQKFKAEEKRQLENQLRDNGFWLGYLQDAATNGSNPTDILTYEKTLDQVTVASTKAAANQYLNSSNFIKLILLPEKK
ncbi:MAG: insulinase family protein [Bacteroidetes bacterium]|nr:insulinase family protein [Bacteroidota bacterium]MBU1484337.1 insulinase family protein [Bacteroidota bacterium]MBU2266796.1 insulinase family protein [Bacteroidota bacterium]MBU2376155.1 insulinase family protein [Bacteroidota bacterium]